MSRKLVVEIIGDASSLEKSYRQAAVSTKKFGGEVERTGKGVFAATVGFKGLGRSVAFASGAFIGGAGITAVLKSSSEAASSLNEQITKTEQVFGKSGRAVVAWSKGSVNALALAQDQALATASSIGALLRPLGITGREAARQSERLVKLGADFSSFYNTNVQDALAAIQSGLVGEIEPLRRYGVVLSEARVQQEALTETGKRHAKQLTQTEKVQARINLIFRDSKLAQGDLARTSGGLANQQRFLAANVRNLQIMLGKALNPVLVQTIRHINDWLADTRNQKRLQDGLNETISKAAGAFRDLAKAIGVATGAYDDFRDSAAKLPGGRKGFFATLLSGTVFAQFDAFRDHIRKATRALGLLNDQASKTPEWLRNLLGPQGSNVPPGLQGIVAGVPPPPGLEGVVRGKPGALPPLPPKGITVAQRNAWFDAVVARDLDKVLDIPTVRGQIRRLHEIAALVQDRIDATKDITRRLTLGDTLRGILRTIHDDQAEIARMNKEAADKAAAAEKKYMESLRKLFKHAVAPVSLSPTTIAAAIRQNLRTLAERNKKLAQQFAVVGGRVTDAQRSAAQFVALGLTRTGDEHGPTIKGLRRRARSLLRRSKTPGMHAELIRIIGVLNGNAGTPTPQVLSKIRDMLDDIAHTLGESAAERVPVVAAPNLRRLAAGLGLGNAQLGQLRWNFNRLNLIGPAGSGPTGGGVIAASFHIPVEVDGRQVALATRRHVVKAEQRRPTQTRGRQTK